MCSMSRLFVCQLERLVFVYNNVFNVWAVCVPAGETGTVYHKVFKIWTTVVSVGEIGFCAP